MILRFITQQSGVNVSPIALRFDSGIALKLRFNGLWPNAVSPITLSFTEVIVPEPPIVNTITRQYGAVWVKSFLTESHTRLNHDISLVEAKKSLNWELNPVKQQHFKVTWNNAYFHITHSDIQWSGLSAYRNLFLLAWGDTRLQQRITTTGYSQRGFHKFNQVLSWSNQDYLLSKKQFGWEQLDYEKAEHVTYFTTSVLIEAYLAQAWGPHKSSWQCDSNYRAPIGRFSLNFSKLWSHSLSPIELRFVESPMVCEYDNGGGLIDGTPTLPPIDFEIPIEPQIRRAYIMQPTLDCIRVSDSQRIVISRINLSHSRGQFSQSVSIDFSSRIDAENAENELLKLSLNGYDFYFICEEKSESKLFGSHSYTANGRSRSAELAAPYELPISYTNNVSRSFAGLLNDLIPFSDWSVILVGVTDFTVPAGAYSTTGKSPLEAINDAAQQVGCMVLSDDVNQTLTVLPRWPMVPWAMSAGNPDITVHEAVIRSHSMKEVHQVLCNSIWLRGEQQGVSCQIKRAGTAGNVNASDISAQLIVDNQAARIAGTNGLADTGKKRIHDITLPIMADLPPLTVGMMVGVRDGATLFKSICDSVSISADVSEEGAVLIEQSISVIESLE